MPPLETGSAIVSASDPSEAVSAKRFVDDAVVEKRVVVVAAPIDTFGTASVFVVVAYVKAGEAATVPSPLNCT